MPEREPSAPGPTGSGADAYIGLGSNVGDRHAHLQRALDRLRAASAVDVRGVSLVYASAAHRLPHQPPQPPFLNAVVHIWTRMPPAELLAALHAIEGAGQRQRPTRWAPRTIDLDLLAYGDRAVTTPGLTLPHPRLADRRFVLQPLVDLAPDLYLPAPFAATAAELLARTSDRAPVEPTPERLD